MKKRCSNKTALSINLSQNIPVYDRLNLCDYNTNPTKCQFFLCQYTNGLQIFYNKFSNTAILQFIYCKISRHYAIIRKNLKRRYAMSRRGENIFKRKDGRWEARYVKEITLNGKKKYGSVYAKSYHEVKVKQLLCINQPLISTKKANLTVDDIMLEWLEQNKNQLKISSYQRYYNTIQNHISKCLGTVQIKYLTKNIIANFTDELLTNQHLSKETANQVLIILGMGLDFAKTQ